MHEYFFFLFEAEKDIYVQCHQLILHDFVEKTLLKNSSSNVSLDVKLANVFRITVTKL